ncbi:MAG: hypothetical protein ACREOS_06295 [Candidatus Dormibacteraceae bacterium]
MARIVCAAATLLLIAALAACGASSTGGPLTVKQAGRAYLAAIRADNATVTTFKATPTADPATTALIGSDLDLTAALLKIRWPAADSADVHALIVDLSQEAISLQDLSAPYEPDAAWMATFSSQEAKHRADVDILRHDLHLAPAVAGFN